MDIDPIASRARVAQARQRLRDIEELMADLRRGPGVPPGLQRAFDTYKRPAELGLDVGDAFADVQPELKRVYSAMRARCEATADPGERDQGDVLLERQWQAIDALWGLQWDNQHSLVRRTWDRWRQTLRRWLREWAEERVSPE